MRTHDTNQLVACGTGEGAWLATAAGFAARPVRIAGADVPDGEQEPLRLLLRAAAREAAACIVIGRSGSMAHEVSCAMRIARCSWLSGRRR